MARPSVLACLWTRLDETSPLAAFVEMAEVLARRGVDMTLVTSQPAPSSALPFSVRTLPPSLAELGRQRNPGPAPACFDLAEFTALEEIWWGPRPGDDEVRRGLAAWHELFEIVHPDAVLDWGTTFPHSRAALRAAQRRMLPCFVLERGHLAGTLMASPMGQNQLAPPGTDPWFADACAQAPVGRWDELVGPLRGRFFDHTRFAAVSPGLPERRRRWRALFVGSFDRGAGVGFDLRGVGSRGLGDLTSTRAAAERLVEAARLTSLDLELVLRPHPFDSGDYSVLESDDVIIARRESLDALFADCDVVVGVTSTVNVGAFVYEKPLITLATSEFGGMSACRTVSTARDLADALTWALTDASGRAAAVESGKRALLTLLSSYLLRWGESAALVRHTVGEFAGWLARFAGAAAR